jgi:hypothetical protein
LAEQDPGTHRKYKRLRAAIMKAWDTITDAEVRHLIRTTMWERCQAVIEANEEYTRF